MQDGKVAKLVRKVPCEVYSRVVGYLRPVLDWNLGRQQEWLDRVPYRLDGQRVVEGDDHSRDTC